jgi:hypothetical protein
LQQTSYGIQIPNDVHQYGSYKDWFKNQVDRFTVAEPVELPLLSFKDLDQTDPRPTTNAGHYCGISSGWQSDQDR